MRFSSSNFKQNLFLQGILFLTLLGLPTNAQSATLTQVKGSQVLVDLQDSPLQISEGQKYFVVVDGKRRAIVQITQVKGSKAIGKILKGKAVVGGQLSSPGSRGDNSGEQRRATRSRQEREEESRMSGNSTFGFLGGYSLDKQDLSVTNSSGATTSTSMSGSGFNFKVFIDLTLTDSLGVIGRFGAEQFSVKDSTGAFKTDILYGTGDLLLRYSFSDGDFVPFLTAGMGLHIPISKTTNALVADNISATTVFLGGLGANIAIGSSSYMTIMGEYGYFLPSANVTTNLIAIRAGFGFEL